MPLPLSASGSSAKGLFLRLRVESPNLPVDYIYDIRQPFDFLTQFRFSVDS